LEADLAKRLKADEKNGVVSTQITHYAKSHGFKVLRKAFRGHRIMKVPLLKVLKKQRKGDVT